MAAMETVCGVAKEQRAPVLFVCQLDNIWGEGSSTEKMPHHIGLWVNPWDIFLINDSCGRAQTFAGYAPSGAGS